MNETFANRPDARAPAAQPAVNQDFWPVDNLQSWHDAPLETLRDWLAQQRILGDREFRDSSCQTYSAMFSAWLHHLTPRRLSVLEASPEDAASFFELSELEPISRRRYLQLLDRVYNHLQACGLEAVNPMLAELGKERELERSLPPSLSDEQFSRLVATIERLPGWKGIRDRGLAALLLGAGLRANEVSQQTLGNVDADYVIHVRPKSVHRPHDTLVVPDGPWRGWFDAWLAERAQRQIPGDFVVPSTLKGNALDPTTVFRRVSAWLDAAGIVAEQSGPNLLRSTFARMVLASERYTLQQVQEFLGHSDSRQTQRHKGGESDLASVL